jgi:hypothetical protein
LGILGPSRRDIDFGDTLDVSSHSLGVLVVTSMCRSMTTSHTAVSSDHDHPLCQLVKAQKRCGVAM